MNSKPIDPQIAAVASELKNLDPSGGRTAQVLRDTIDQLYDGQRTGRYRWDQLFKTEKTHCGTLVEINLHREFEFQDGITLDYSIAGVEVDCKFSQTMGGWMIPPEAQNHICLLVWAEDSANPKWSIGLVRATVEHLNTGGNRDCKATLNAVGRTSINWLFKDAPLPPNILLQLDRALVEKIMALESGQKRVNAIFRLALEKPVGGGVIATLAQQDDYMKRVRGNGGARGSLKSEGIIILGQYKKHALIARAVGAPVPQRGESVAVRVAPVMEPGSGVANISGGFWRVALPSDPPCIAPDLPSIRKERAKVIEDDGLRA